MTYTFYSGMRSYPSMKLIGIIIFGFIGCVIGLLLGLWTVRVYIQHQMPHYPSIWSHHE